MNWIKASDKKPRDSERIICLRNNSGRYSVVIYMYSKYFDAWSDGFQYFDYDCVEAWISLESLIDSYINGGKE